MKKNIIIPIVAALMSVVFAVGIAAGIYIIEYKEVWISAHAVSRHAFIRKNRPEGYDNSFDLVRSYDELIGLCNLYGNHFASEDSADCDCKMCARLRNYDEKFFENKALIICEVSGPDYGTRFAIKSLTVKDQTLTLDLYKITYGGAQAVTYQHLFIAVKKSKVEDVTVKIKTITDKTLAASKQERELPWGKKIIEVDGEPIFEKHR